MLALKAQHNLRTWFYQLCTSFYPSVLRCELSYVSTVENKTPHSVKSNFSKLKALRRNIENKQLFGPVIKPKNNRLSNKKKRSSSLKRTVESNFNGAKLTLSPTSSVATTRELSEIETKNLSTSSEDIGVEGLSESEMKILEDVIYNCLIFKALRSKGKNKYRDSIAKICNIPNPNMKLPQCELPETVTPKKEDLNSINGNIEMEKPATSKLEISFPLCSTTKHNTKEEDVINLKSTIPAVLNIGKEIVSTSHVLECTRSNSDKNGNRRTTLSDEEKTILENHLSPHVIQYLESKSPENFPDPDLPKDLLGYWKSMQHVLKQVTEVQGFDVETTHPALCYTATADVVCSYNGHLVMLDWKTHIGLTNSSVSVRDYSLLAMACVGALNFDAKFSFQEPFNAVSLVSYSSGKPAHALLIKSVTANVYWINWLQRLSMYYRGRTDQRLKTA